MKKKTAIALTLGLGIVVFLGAGCDRSQQAAAAQIYLEQQLERGQAARDSLAGTLVQLARLERDYSRLVQTTQQDSVLLEAYEASAPIWGQLTLGLPQEQMELLAGPLNLGSVVEVARAATDTTDGTSGWLLNGNLANSSRLYADEERSFQVWHGVIKWLCRHESHLRHLWAANSRRLRKMAIDFAIYNEAVEFARHALQVRDNRGVMQAARTYIAAHSENKYFQYDSAEYAVLVRHHPYNYKMALWWLRRQDDGSAAAWQQIFQDITSWG